MARARKYGPVSVDGRDGVRCKCGTFTPAGAWAIAHINETDLDFTCPAMVMKKGGPDKCGRKTTVPRDSW